MPTKPHQTIIDCNPFHPGPKVAFVAKSVNLGDDSKEGILQYLLRIVGIIGVVMDYREQSAGVVTYQSADDLGLHRLESFNDYLLISRGSMH